MYTSIGDYLTHRGALSEAQRRSAAEEQDRLERFVPANVNVLPHFNRGESSIMLL